MSLRQLGRFAALPTRPEYGGGGTAIVRTDTIIGGPHVSVGPFLFPADIGIHTFKTTYNKLVSTADGRKLMSDILLEVGEQTGKHTHITGCWSAKYKDGFWGLDMGQGCALTEPQLAPNWRNRDDPRMWQGLPIPNGMLWDVRFLTAGVKQLPVYRFVHPTKNENWGMYVDVALDGTWTFSLKKVVVTDWLTKMWNGIKEIVAKLVSFVSDALRALKGAVCAAAQSKLEELANYAEKKAVLPAGVAGEIASKTGIPLPDLDKLTGAMPSAMIQDMGLRVIAGFCPQDTPKSPIVPVATSGVSAGLVVAGLGAAGILAYFLLR